MVSIDSNIHMVTVDYTKSLLDAFKAVGAECENIDPRVFEAEVPVLGSGIEQVELVFFRVEEEITQEQLDAVLEEHKLFFDPLATLAFAQQNPSVQYKDDYASTWKNNGKYYTIFLFSLDNERGADIFEDGNFEWWDNARFVARRHKSKSAHA